MAKALAKLTGFKLFHNHLSVECVLPVFDFGTDSFWKLVETIREEIIAESAREGRDLIYTVCFAKGDDDEHVAKIVKAVEESGGEVCFVQLTCERGELEKRVLNEDRKKFNKASNLGKLNEILGKYDMFSPVSGYGNLHIDNTGLPPEEAARQISEHYKLI